MAMRQFRQRPELRQGQQEQKTGRSDDYCLIRSFLLLRNRRIDEVTHSYQAEGLNARPLETFQAEIENADEQETRRRSTFWVWTQNASKS
jgi:hypothetical protein